MRKGAVNAPWFALCSGLRRARRRTSCRRRCSRRGSVRTRRVLGAMPHCDVLNDVAVVVVDAEAFVVCVGSDVVEQDCRCRRAGEASVFRLVATADGDRGAAMQGPRPS